MALFEFRLPDIGEGVAEGEVVAWHVTPEQRVNEDQDMVEVMTDKATVMIGAPKAGRIAQLNAKVGDVVRVGSVLVVIDTEPGELRESERRAREEPARENERRPSRPPSESDTARSRFQAPASRTPTRPPASPKREESTAASAVGDIRETLPGVSFFTRAAKNGQNASERVAEAFEGDKPGSHASARAQAPNSPAFAADPRARSAGTSGASATVHAALAKRDSLHQTTGDAPSLEAARRTPQTALVEEHEHAGAKHFADKPLATPATRKLARDLGIDLRLVPPTGAHGRVTKLDLEQFSSTRGAAQEAREERKPFVGLRRRIAENMQRAKHKAAHFTFVEEVEVDALKALIERAKPAAEKRGVKLHFLPFIVKAVTLALQKHPILNSTLDEQHNELVYRRYYHIGVATATEQGLVVPVVRDADQKSPLAIAAEIQRLAEGARTGKLSASELSGSTFTVTSLGRLGGLLATPVLNYPEVGILGVHRVKERPVVRDGKIEIGHIMLLSLSFDHRIVDGHIGAAFAYDVIAYLEQPELLLLELA